jgi:hypothetical protein
MIQITLAFEEQGGQNICFTFNQGNLDGSIQVFVGDNGNHIEAGKFVDKMQEFLDAVRPLVRA